ncbi:hypothetical protein JTE90_017260 [Oedothorax gibbosus]|uniref:Crustacean cardioactive peptide n=1 Tax=Oedothorax gibbosus TaxID=931172 RepID=A0AAV6VGJ6_9ARAC|nr:hypothetical protein JTE90_017260 [Oedothorax gibbosus]
MVNSTYLTFIMLTVLAIVFTVSSDSLDQDRLNFRVKRPFCNAFTGCGRKRSGESGGAASNELYQLLQQRMAEVDALKGLLDETRK